MDGAVGSTSPARGGPPPRARGRWSSSPPARPASWEQGWTGSDGHAP